MSCTPDHEQMMLVLMSKLRLNVAGSAVIRGAVKRS